MAKIEKYIERIGDTLANAKSSLADLKLQILTDQSKEMIWRSGDDLMQAAVQKKYVNGDATYQPNDFGHLTLHNGAQFTALSAAAPTDYLLAVDTSGNVRLTNSGAADTYLELTDTPSDHTAACIPFVNPGATAHMYSTELKYDAVTSTFTTAGGGLTMAPAMSQVEINTNTDRLVLSSSNYAEIELDNTSVFVANRLYTYSLKDATFGAQVEMRHITDASANDVLLAIGPTGHVRKTALGVTGAQGATGIQGTQGATGVFGAHGVTVNTLPKAATTSTFSNSPVVTDGTSIIVSGGSAVSNFGPDTAYVRTGNVGYMWSGKQAESNLAIGYNLRPGVGEWRSDSTVSEGGSILRLEQNALVYYNSVAGTAGSKSVTNRFSVDSNGLVTIPTGVQGLHVNGDTTVGIIKITGTNTSPVAHSGRIVFKDLAGYTPEVGDPETRYSAICSQAQTFDFRTGSLETLADSTSMLSVGLGGLTHISGYARLIMYNNADTGQSAVLDLGNTTTSPHNDDEVGRIGMYGYDDATNITSLCEIVGRVKDCTNGSEDGELTLSVYSNGNYNGSYVKINGATTQIQTSNLNHSIGGTAARSGTVGTNVINIFNGTAPAGTLTDGCSIFCQNDTTSAELYTMDENGVATKISPHNEAGEWEFYSKNTVTGKVLRIDMEKMMRFLNDKFKLNCIHEYEEA